MTVLTPYSLKPGNSHSNDYYQAVAGLADRWTEQARITLAKPVERFLDFTRTRQVDIRPAVERSLDEACFELLVVGVLLREHGAQALQMAPAPAWMLARLIETQDRLPLPAVEKPIKAVRGLVQGLSAGGRPGDDFETLPQADTAAEVMARLLAWLRAGGMTAQADRIADWHQFIAGLDEQSAQAVLARCLLAAEDFAAQSETALGQYTTQAEAFAACIQTQARWRYDAGLVTRTRVEYHLGMLGTEILSRVYRARYLTAERKIVIVPDCLCAHSLRLAGEAGGPECQAARTALGGLCQACTPGCRVQVLTQLGQKRGFEVYILPDNMRGIGLGSCSTLKGVGVVGVSCALTNWDAGWQVNDAGVPAQGILLDYAGCRNHWDDQGVSTDLNLKKLLAVVGPDSTEP